MINRVQIEEVLLFQDMEFGPYLWVQWGFIKHNIYDLRYRLVYCNKKI